jgi:hypothetical protein
MGGTYQDILSSGKVESVIAGSNITIDITDPANPIINSIVNNTIVVANYSALPAVGTVTGKFYWASAEEGSRWNPFTGAYKNAGMYYSNGVTWEFLNVPYNATQSEVNTGTNTDKFVTPNTLTNATVITNKELLSNKDATGGYAGLTLFKINFKNVANTFTSFFTNSNTASRTYTFQDRNGTIADNTDLALKSGTSILDSLIFSGSYMPTRLGFSPTTGTAGFNGYLIAHKITGRKSMIAISLSMYVNGAPVPGNIRLAIYSDLNGLPNALLVDSGDIATSSAGLKEALITAKALPEGAVYHAAFQMSNGNMGPRYYSGGTEMNYYNPADNSFHSTVVAAYTYGAFPAIFPAVIYTQNVAYNAQIFIKQQ